MEAIKLHITVESDTVKIPELKKFIGKSIEIILIDDSEKEKPASNRYKRLKDLKGKINFDEEAVNTLRQKIVT
jgi:hypothetical protein